MPALKLQFPKSLLSSAAMVWLMALLMLVPAIWLLIHDQFSILAFLLCIAPLLVVIRYDKVMGIFLTLLFLFFLGDIRRIINMEVGYPKVDPVLLVGPIVTIILVVPLLMRIRLTDSISKAVFAYTIIVALEIVNPRQGPITVGLGGAMFYLIPLLWFWIGHKYGTPRVLYSTIYRVILPVAIAAGVLGIYQTVIGFLPWEDAWIKAAGYNSLHLGSFNRAIGFSSNGIEYVNLLVLATVCSFGAFLAGRRIYGLLTPFFAVMLFLGSSRASVLRAIFAIAIAWALSNRGGKGWAVRLPFGLAILFGVLTLAAGRTASDTSDQSNGSFTNQMTQHQVQGLAHPLDSQKSTAKLHFSMIFSAVAEGFRYPVGRGTGFITAGAKLGGSGGSSQASGSDESEAYSTGGSSEYDFSDAFLAFGPIGGFLYLGIYILIARRAIAFGRFMPQLLGLPLLAILAGMLGSWVPLGQYAMGPLMWFLIGSLSGIKLPEPRKAGVARSSVNLPRAPQLRPASAQNIN